MAERDDSQLELLLREHLTAKLDGQLGRAADRFLREFANDDAEAAAQVKPMRLAGEGAQSFHHAHRRSPWSVLAWSIGLSGGAIAAGLLVVTVLAPMVQRNQPLNGQPPIAINNGVRPSTNDTNTDAAPPTPVQPADAQPDVEHVLTWNTIDQGTIYVDGDLPLRSVVRQANETLRWYDPQRQAHVELTVPRDEVMLVGFGSQ